MKTTGQKIIEFYDNLELQPLKEKGVGILNPFKKAEVQDICSVFYNRFYQDYGKRIFLIGINPGRFGAGVTGLPFTDPILLEERVGIKNTFQKRKELSAVFIHEIIDAFGGLESFYSQFYFTSVSPLGFVKDGKNCNYYDYPSLQKELTPFIIRQMNHQVTEWGRSDIAFTIGKGQNHKVLVKLNDTHKWFDKIVALPHPRWVMQYRLKSKDLILDEIIASMNSEI
tara:strand:+ start:63616 stop:64293 length:678 start_codon:yes stop_codon:yes gene_type:complete